MRLKKKSSLKSFLKKKKYSATGNRTPVSRVTGGDTHHYTIVELPLGSIMHIYQMYEYFQSFWTGFKPVVWTEFLISRWGRRNESVISQDRFLEIIFDLRQFSWNRSLESTSDSFDRVRAELDMTGHKRTLTNIFRNHRTLSKSNSRTYFRFRWVCFHY